MGKYPGPWVCSICGSSRIQSGSVQDSLGDPAHPLGLCWDCRGAQPMPNDKKQIEHKKVRHPLSPLCRPEEWHEKRRRARATAPEDLFGSLSEEERKALERPINARPVVR